MTAHCVFVLARVRLPAVRVVRQVEAPDKAVQYVLFAAEPYETIAFKIPNLVRASACAPPCVRVAARIEARTLVGFSRRAASLSHPTRQAGSCSVLVLLRD